MKQKFHPLFSAHVEEPPVNHGGSGDPATPPAPETTTEDPPAPAAPTEDPPTEDPPTEEPAPAPEAPAGAEPPVPTAGAPLSAFERGKLRALGMGGLIARVEKAETALTVASAEIARLKGENTRLAADLAKVPAKVEAAQKGRENEVSKQVTAELTSLGLSAEKAPAQLTPEAADKTKTRAEFNALSHPERNAFMREGGKIAD